MPQISRFELRILKHINLLTLGISLILSVVGALFILMIMVIVMPLNYQDVLITEGANNSNLLDDLLIFLPLVIVDITLICFIVQTDSAKKLQQRNSLILTLVVFTITYVL
ncbi:hypothetical protein [Nonlabens sp.]|uniref:hypothetical protein n=1 Tax=Nonlabens sp. TaxID=1888209 RepID=UPI003266D41D